MGISEAFNKTVIAVNFNDIMCGTYIYLIWGANFYYGEVYAVKEHKWG